ncbi:hypothetical protein [Paenibacillus sp. QZ-Y1]|uniref:hypothetical protein n=1 Tax=Paenibacillus sp. QZ-Y1 TaxID=3414511 RepID=UPI003F7B01B1
MSINDSTLIDVHNYTDGCVAVASNIKQDGYLFEPSSNDIPYVLQLSFSEVRGINTQSHVFREGYLRFDPAKEKDIYEALGVRNWETILTNKDIEKIILEPTKEGLELLMKIDSTSLFERVRGMVTQLDNSNAYDISTRVKNAIDSRYKELYEGKRITAIQIRKTSSEMEAEESSKKQKELEEILAEERKKIEAEIRAEFEAKQNENKETKKQTGKRVSANGAQEAPSE